MGSSRYDKPIIPWIKKERDKPDPTDRIAVMIEEAWLALAKVEHFPEDKPDGVVNLISLRNLVPDLLRELQTLNDERKRRGPKPSV